MATAEPTGPEQHLEPLAAQVRQIYETSQTRVGRRVDLYVVAKSNSHAAWF